MYNLPRGYKGRLLCSINCTTEYEGDKYFQSDGVHVSESKAGRCREAPNEPFMHFGYRFDIENTNKPHMMIIRYPDDKRRYMCINDGTCYDLSTGVITGGLYPVSGEMKCIYNIFWPRWKECSVIFSTWGAGEPAAVEGFSVYELNDLPATDFPALTFSDRRTIGIQYEDPCGSGASEGAKSFETWLERHIQFMRHTGQNRLVYPINWYHGPRFPSKTQPPDTFDWVVAEDRNQYCRSTTHPDDWLTDLLEKFDKEKLEFVGSMTLLRLGNLLKSMNINIDDINSGGDTINNMLYNNEVQSSCGDWTTIYNVSKFTELVAWQEAGKNMSEFEFAYGERKGDFHGGPMFNPLHPEVQRQILDYIKEISEKYGKYKSFKGISINMWHATILWYGSIYSGYDDYTVRLFEKETGIITKVPSDDPERFSKRYQQLAFKYRSDWIEWRCRKIHSFICKIRDILKQNGLTLTLNFWSEPSKKIILGEFTANTQYGARSSEYEFLREAGADLLLLGTEDGIQLDVETNQQRDRGWDVKGVDTPIENSVFFHDHNYLDDSWHKALRNSKIPGCFIFDCWVESWGRHIEFNCEENDPNISEIKKMYHSEAEYVYRMNSIYPEDGFWWDSRLQITSALPTYPYYLEPFAFALAEYDTLNITRGGLYLNKANAEQICEFSRSYRALPNKKFETVGTYTDPVAIRKLLFEGKLYFYAVSREPYPIRLIIHFDRPGTVIDMSDLNKCEAVSDFEINLKPFDLKVFTTDIHAKLTGYDLELPYEIKSSILKAVYCQLHTFRKIKTQGKNVAGMDKLIDETEAAILQQRYSWLRHALTCYISAKANEISMSQQSDNLHKSEHVTNENKGL